MNETINNSPKSSIEKIISEIKMILFDFDGVFTDNSVYVLEDGTEAVRCWRSDGIGLSRLKKFDIQTMVISTETNPVVTARCKKLGIKCIQGCDDKAGVMEKTISEFGFTLKQTSYVGNDINDLECLQIAGLPIIVKDSHPDVFPFAKHVTQTPGGHGAVREICDLFVSVLES